QSSHFPTNPRIRASWVCCKVTSVPSMHSPSRPKVSWRPGTRRVRSMFGTSPLLLRYLRGRGG
ncbi:unnamed protein product, partial [Symbiodinium pilosum]